VRLLGVHRIEEFIRKHPDTKGALRRWHKLMVESDYRTINEMRKTFPHADYVKGKTVFNVGDNKVRTITVIQYEITQVIITDILTHAEYDREQWKE
jgi:mRNA interferase HigB